MFLYLITPFILMLSNVVPILKFIYFFNLDTYFVSVICILIFLIKGENMSRYLKKLKEKKEELEQKLKTDRERLEKQKENLKYMKEIESEEHLIKECESLINLLDYWNDQDQRRILSMQRDIEEEERGL